MNDEWEMCIIDKFSRSKVVYTLNGVERERLDSEEKKAETIKDLLAQGWEPFAGSGEAVPEAYPHGWDLYFRRRAPKVD
jgi:hypothetical protein